MTMRSDNYNARRGGMVPHYLIFHYTGMETAQSAVARLCDPAAEVSAHYVIDEDGSVLALVDENERAWHAGVSYWRGQRDMNSASIGVEIVNPGHEFGYRPFPDAQIRALVDLSRDVMQRWGIGAAGVLGHSDIAPARKADPGEYFPWQRLAASGVGRWPVAVELHYERAQDLLSSGEDLTPYLHQLGYDPDCARDLLWRAFHRHYAPELFNESAAVDWPCLDSVARLLALL